MLPTLKPPSLTQLWYRWKSLKLPWRKQFLVGLDLQGNTFWEFRDSLHSHQNRMRRIVKCSRSLHYSEIDISPQWHQWLRHTRADPPSLAEQSQDISRQEKLKVLSAAADARWTTEPSLHRIPAPLSQIEMPSPGITSNVLQANFGETLNGRRSSGLNQPGSDQESSPPKRSDSTKKMHQKDPWKQALGAPGEEWKPETWDGKPSRS